MPASTPAPSTTHLPDPGRAGSWQATRLGAYGPTGSFLHLGGHPSLQVWYMDSLLPSFAVFVVRKGEEPVLSLPYYRAFNISALLPAGAAILTPDCHLP